MQAKILVFDEPTAALSVKEVGYVLNYIQSLKEKGVSVVVIAHNIIMCTILLTDLSFWSTGIRLGNFSKMM